MYPLGSQTPLNAAYDQFYTQLSATARLIDRGMITHDVARSQFGAATITFTTTFVNAATGMQWVGYSDERRRFGY